MIAPRPIHIMHLLPSLETGGMENGVVNVVNALDRARFVSGICCLERSGPLRERLKPDVAVVVLDQKPGIRWGLPFALKRVFAETKPDIIHTHNYYTLFYGLPAAKLARVPVIIHGEHGRAGDASTRRAKTAALLCRGADSVVTVSQDLKNVLVGKGMPADKIEIILNGIDTVRYDLPPVTPQERAAVGLQTGEPVIGAVGRLSPVKNYPSLIRAFAQVRARVPNARLVFIGSGPQKSELETLAASQGLGPAVVFLGERDDVHKLYRLFDVFALSSLSEGMSNAVLEAMAAGLPVVATRVGDNPLLLNDGETGILVPADDTAALARELTALLQDTAKARALGAAARVRARETFGFPRMIGSYETLYETWARKKGAIH